jgi:hypothetical protein
MRTFLDEERDDACCGSCKYHKKIDGTWICTNELSDCFECATEYTDYCNDHTEKGDYTWEKRRRK